MTSREGIRPYFLEVTSNRVKELVSLQVKFLWNETQYSLESATMA